MVGFEAQAILRVEWHAAFKRLDHYENISFPDDTRTKQRNKYICKQIIIVLKKPALDNLCRIMVQVRHLWSEPKLS